MSLALGRTQSDIVFADRVLAEPRGGPSMVEDFKNQHFTRMWNEENKSKRAKFRNLMKSKLDLLHVEVTEENARAFYNGRLESRQPERIYQMPERSDDRRPPRRR